MSSFRTFLAVLAFGLVHSAPDTTTAKTAAAAAKEPPPPLHDGGDASHLPPEYSFSWRVQDQYSKNDYGQSENREGEKTEGSYYVLLPDGRTQKVTYSVDAYSGFQANVEFVGDILQPAASTKSSRAYQRPRPYTPARVSRKQYTYKAVVPKTKEPVAEPIASAAEPAKVYAVKEPEQKAAAPVVVATTEPQPSYDEPTSPVTTTTTTTPATPTTTSESYQSKIEPLPSSIKQIYAYRTIDSSGTTKEPVAVASTTPKPAVSTSLPPPGKIYYKPVLNGPPPKIYYKPVENATPSPIYYKDVPSSSNNKLV